MERLAWLFGAIVAALLAGPHLAQWWLRRAGRTERIAARWWASDPVPVEVAFLSGGPGRVVDLIVAGMVADGSLTVGDDGRLATADQVDDGSAFRHAIHDRLAHGNTDVAALRFVAPEMPMLWHTAARERLMLPAGRRKHTPWLLAGAVVVAGYCVSIPLPGATLAIGAGAVALGVLSLWRTRFLVGYGFDPRTAAGLRAAELAGPANHLAAHGLRSASDLRPGAHDRHPLSPSRWHAPWYL